MIISFTGHRPNKLWGYDLSVPKYDRVREALSEILMDKLPEYAISGMALGFDQLAAEVCIFLRIPFVAAVPFKGQESKWPRKSQEKYKEILTKAKDIVYVCPPGYAPYKMQERNEWMVGMSDLVIALWDGTPGGTGNCVRYAKSVLKDIIVINPLDL